MDKRKIFLLIIGLIAIIAIIAIIVNYSKKSKTQDQLNQLFLQQSAALAGSTGLKNQGDTGGSDIGGKITGLFSGLFGKKS